MSVVTNILIKPGFNDVEDVNNNIAKIQEYLNKKYPFSNVKLTRITDYVECGKAIEQPLWAVAVNYLDVEEFVKFFWSLDWENEEYTQLLIAKQYDNGYHNVTRHGCSYDY